jgi:HD-GYP domain-containing protein (c-di-GMP phosphodiesterase class II)
MAKIEIADIHEGMVVEYDLTAGNGQLLFAKGTVITAQHLKQLMTRNIFELNSKIEQRVGGAMLSDSAFKKLIDFEPPPPVEPALPGATPDAKPPIRNELGELEVNFDLQRYKSTPKPSGRPLKQKLVRTENPDRTRQYKESLIALHKANIGRTTSVLERIAHGHTCDVNDIMPIVENCVTLYITDRNILMALTTMPCRVDDYLYRHALNTCIMSIGIAVALGYSDRQVVEIGLCALLENVGMLLVDKSVSLKGRTSTHEDLLELKKHPDLGARLLKKVVRLPETVPLVASQAHEREDGSGYPAGKRGHLIHPFAKIIQIADVFDTMCNPAGSESAFTANEAMHSILKMTRRGQLLKEYAIAFISYVGLFPVGSFVELSDHRIARVVHAHAREFFKPIVSIISNTQATLLPDTDILLLDLSSPQCTMEILKAAAADTLGSLDVLYGF